MRIIGGTLYSVRATWSMRGLWLLLALGFLLPLWGQRAAPGDRVAMEMRNVNYHFTDTIAVDIRSLRGALIPARPGGLPVFDDKQSFIIHIDSGEIAIATGAMTQVLNDYVFAGRDAPLRKIEVSTEGDKIKIKGVLHSQGDLPFETKGRITATPDGKIRIHTTDIKAAHLPAKGIMDLLGVKISDLITGNKVRGVRTEADDLILDPEQILPPPAVRGRLSAVRVEGDSIVELFGTGATRLSLSHGARNYMAYRGGTLRFGKLTMNDTDLELIDLDPRDPLDFFLDRYKDQLVAGYTKTTAAFGLRVFVPDYGKIAARPRTTSTGKSE